MRIGIDCRLIYDIENNWGAGIERYVFHLVKNILTIDKENKFVLFVDERLSQKTINHLRQFGKFKLIKVKNRIPFFSPHFFFTFKLWAEWLHWMIFPANTMPFFYVGKSLLVIHDLAIYNNPQWFPNKQWLSKLLVVPSSVAKATKVVTISDTTRKEFFELFKFRRKDKVKVVYPGVVSPQKYSELAIKQVLEKYNIKNKFLLFVGTVEPRKNIVRICKAFEKYTKETSLNLELIIAGANGWKDKKIFQTIDLVNENLQKNLIKYLGKITDKEKNILMQKCSVFVFPSLYEGFGLPVLEAMGNNAPVITSNVSATDEFIDNQAIKVNPKSIDEIFLAIKKILEDQEFTKQLCESGEALVKKFSWQKTAQQILEFIQEKKGYYQRYLENKRDR